MRVTIIRDCAAAPDHVRTRQYKAGEQFEVGHPLMPKGLADLLVKGGAFENKQVKDAVGALIHVAKIEVPAATMEDKPLDAEWAEIIKGMDEKGKPYQKTKHDLMLEELFGKSNNIVLMPW